MIVPRDTFFEVFKKTNGALSVCEAIAIMNIAEQAPEGNYMELGVNRGKSAYAASYSLPFGNFYLVEPEFADKEWEAGVVELVSNFRIKPIPIADYSTNVIDKHGDYAYVFVDSGSHGDGLPMQEVTMLEDRMVKGGIIGFHDYLSQFTEVELAYNYLLGTGKYEAIKIDWSEIIEYVKANDLENGNTSWHHNELDFPTFLGALRRL